MMILAKGNELGPIVKEGDKYTLEIKSETITLEKEEWDRLVNTSVTEFPLYLNSNHPDIRRAIKVKEGTWMGELYELIQKAADEENRSNSQKK